MQQQIMSKRYGHKSGGQLIKFIGLNI